MDCKVKKLHLGAGHQIKEGWTNHDLISLPGIDTVHDLTQFPWPWPDSYFDEVYAKDVLEHLPNTVQCMEEIFRITKPNAMIYIAVPYWNSWEAITDPTHISQFNEFTFEFFDPTQLRCRNRPYYSHARFLIKKLGFGVKLVPYFDVPINWNGRRRYPLSKIFPWKYTIFYHPLPKWIFGVLACYLNNIIIGLEIYLERCD